VSDTVDIAAAHRPYGLDCKCGSPINSDEDWAQHLIDALGLTKEVRDAPVIWPVSLGQLPPGRLTRLVSPWVRADYA
jgi:hypothetical protein